MKSPLLIVIRNYMKKQIFIFLLIFISSALYSQEYNAMKYDAECLIGTWIGTSLNKSYEIDFKVSTISSEEINQTYEVILGSISILENGKIIKTIKKDGINSPIIAMPYEDNKFMILYKEKDERKNIHGNGYFDINIDEKTARWHSLIKAESFNPTKEDFDIPKELFFTKKD